MSPFIARFGRDHRGATAVEYALIAFFISIVLVTGATQLGKDVNVAFKNVENGFPNS